MKHRFPVLVLLIILMSSLVSGLKDGRVAAGSATSQKAENEFLRNFTEALDVIQDKYADDVGSDKLVYSAIKGMLRALDPHSSFFEPKEFSRLREEQHSKYYGLGIRVRSLIRERGRVVIVEPPATGSPAERRGLRAGDVITRIEGEPIDDWPSDEVVGHPDLAHATLGVKALEDVTARWPAGRLLVVRGARRRHGSVGVEVKQYCGKARHPRSAAVPDGKR